MSGKYKLLRLFVSVLLLVTTVSTAFGGQSALAAQITARSLQLQAGVADGGSKASGVVNHFYTFTIPTTGNVGSIQFLYCTTASGTCTTPTGLATTAATLNGTQTGATGFTLGTTPTVDGAPYITRAPSSVTGPQVVTYKLDGITNPSTANQTFYVRISTWTLADLGGASTDAGVVAASTASQIILTGQMPESLIFCAGATISAPGGIPDCSTATSGAISFNQLFSPVDTAYATSQMAASTNAGSGYNITVNGTTMTSGSNTVTAMNSADISRRSVSQFGLNLMDNTPDAVTPDVGTAITAASNGTDLRAQALAGYSTDGTFKFTPGESVADSANGGAGPTNAQIMTVSYIVNVAGSQAAGTYTTTLTYICTATF
ncbi:hypothetical protein COV88_00165 [Candidatus Saccharibacteria bacterium CG11_big_fil_rev_8_21_14_0_20_41_19]|nr:hypothetical protein [Candidatus Saccharibacteria bacterium]OIP85418.1 MAG: hypothetical protein AUK57_03835 [Candidatus Saccharibacteria bacterium CG2_30_41_52]PIQ71197.1 MAG: hypothetical protein COV88_00165 [Candidatus Saccharibacteria bacterium CG11_big_fil_rev_8_21_14_0_20_41_19]PIZ59856.1 MAG: hypothetical protein COY18_02710 [Candidatus Saccharibacteria bacterium CG_4_10_14_0_2_um_filter_41_11]